MDLIIQRLHDKFPSTQNQALVYFLIPGVGDNFIPSPKDIWQCPEIFFILTTEGKEVLLAWVGRGQSAAK